MSTRYHRQPLILFVTLLAAIGASSASAEGWLAGGSFGPAKQFDYEVGGPIANNDNSDTGYRVFGGYLFNPNYGVVTSYVDLGAANYDGPAFGGFTDTLDSEGVDVSFIVALAPGAQERTRIFSTIGLFTWTQDVHYVDGSGTYDYHDSGRSLSFGVGTEITLGAGDAAQWGVHFEWQRFRKVGDKNNSGHQYDRELVSVGVDYRFGR